MTNQTRSSERSTDRYSDALANVPPSQRERKRERETKRETKTERYSYRTNPVVVRCKFEINQTTVTCEGQLIGASPRRTAR